MTNGERCKHHWFLDQRSYGVCKKCGAKKQFPTPGDVLKMLEGRRPNIPSGLSPYGRDDEMRYALELTELCTGTG